MGSRETDLRVLTGRQIRWYNEGMGEKVKIGSKSFSRGQISRGTSLSLPYVSRVFSGQRTPSLSTLKKIAEFAGVTVEDVIASLPKPS